MVKEKKLNEEEIENVLQQSQNKINTDNGIDTVSIIKPVATTTAGAGAGVVGAIAGITAAAVFEIVLPVTLCLWACGVTGGAFGLALGIGKKKK